MIGEQGFTVSSPVDGENVSITLGQPKVFAFMAVYPNLFSQHLCLYATYESFSMISCSFVSLFMTD